MKKYIILILSLILILCSVSCTAKKDLPDTVTIEDEEYRKTFIGRLYPTDASFPDADDGEGTRLYGEYYYKYLLTDFDCYIAHDKNAEPNVYFSSEQVDEAFSFYNDANNFNFFCLIGNIHDENEQQIYEIHEINSLMFDSLLEFAEKNDYDPLTSFNNEENLKNVPIPNPDDWMADEIHFYKESRDGAFTTSRAYTFILHENSLYLLYQYDFSDDKMPVMLIRDIPEEISNYFESLLDNLQSK